LCNVGLVQCHLVVSTDPVFEKRHLETPILSSGATPVTFFVAETQSEAITLRFASKTRKGAGGMSGTLIAFIQQ
jgi:hypothetical protein